jgi:hypothetical protein
MQMRSNSCSGLGFLLVTILSLSSSLVFGGTCDDEFRGKISWDEKGQIALPMGAKADLVENGIMRARNGSINGVSEAIFSFPKGILFEEAPEFIMHVRLRYEGTYESEGCTVKGVWECDAELLSAIPDELGLDDDAATALLCRIQVAPDQPLQPLPISFTAVSRGDESWSFIITTLGIISSGSAYKL